MKGKDAYESLEAALDCLKAYNCVEGPSEYAWLVQAMGWAQKAIVEIKDEKASLRKKEVVA